MVAAPWQIGQGQVKRLFKRGGYGNADLIDVAPQSGVLVDWSCSTEMNPLVGLLTPLLVLLPATDLPAGGDPVDAPVAAEAGLTHESAQSGAGAADGEFRSFRAMVDGLRNDRAGQVRIEQRVIIRIAPAPVSRPPIIMPRRGMPDWRRNMFSDFPSRIAGPRFAERRMVQCLPVSGIAGVKVTEENRLVLFMRDQKLVGTALDKACNPRDFYSGFYLERSADGMLCAGRDTLHARSGANCALGKLHQLIEIDEEAGE